MNLVAHHMLQTLIIGGVQEDHDFHLLSSKSVVHHFVTVALVPEIMELIGDIIDSLALERCRITFVTIQTSDLTQDSLDQMTNSHTRWNSVRVDNHVGNDSFTGERQIFLAISQATSSFLSVTTGKLVTDLRRLDSSHFDLDQSVHLFVGSQNDLINIAFLRVLQRHRPIFLRLSVQLLLRPLVKLLLRDRCHLADNDIVTTDLCAGADDSIAVKLIIGAMLAPRGLERIRDAELFTWRKDFLIGTVEDRSEESAIDRTLIQHDRIFLIVTRVGRNGNDRVTAGSQLFESKVLHRLRGDQRLLRVVEHVSQGVHSHLVVRGVHTHSLLAHRTLISVTGRLVMIREGDDGGTDSKNH